MSYITKVPPFAEVWRDPHDLSDCARAYHWESYFVFGLFSPREIIKQTNYLPWQKCREKMHGEPLNVKWNTLRAYLQEHSYNHHSQCVVTNYVLALKRNGIIR